MSEQHENDHSAITSSNQSTNQSSDPSLDHSAQSQSSDKSNQPNDAELRAAVLSLLQDADLNTITPKAIRASMEEHFDCSMNERKAFIKQIAADFVADQQPPDDDMEDQADEPVDQEEQDRVMAEALQLQLGGRPRRSTAAQPAKPKKKRPALNNPRPKRPPPEVSFSPALLQFLGGEPPVTRGEVTKRIWVYIKENNLQNESDKRKIIIDEQLSTLFGKNTKTIDMFKMTKSLAKHMKSARDLAG